MFTKKGRIEDYEKFLSEKENLLELTKFNSNFVIPEVIETGIVKEEGYSFISMTKLNLGEILNEHYFEIGKNLAILHDNSIKSKESTNFGWHKNNFIGDNRQINDWNDNWVDFFITCRLEYQLSLLSSLYSDLKAEIRSLYEKIPKLFENYIPECCLVHGDLWQGNIGVTYDNKEEKVCIFDPASYWGDAEVDLAMIELFVAVPNDFYDGYRSIRNIDSGYFKRKSLYNLYHLLNHLNLFGWGYFYSVEEMLGKVKNYLL
eukprot:TRINITY_DN3373_c0_g1_i1.p1 TRINITY_DN3373_c0_g1~~TRINITY_DN3373_c0_g1_i1.p1  ORF type:complete len:271 (+),score=59.72 TRINITY_DN3373_c0_g1_i1:34-813(+)